MSRQTVYMGATADREHVYAEIEIAPSRGNVVTFTDHTTGPAPERVSISFTVLAKHYANPATAPDSQWLTAGQVSPESRVVSAPAVPAETIAAIESAWLSSHLNDMHAGCDHMTAEMLAHRVGESVRDWQGRMIAETACPVTGYRWGSSWLAKTPAPEVVAALRAALEFAL